MVHRALLTSLATVAALALGVPASLADASDSSNWSGYAVHRPGVRFTTVSALWKQPSATCSPGNQTYAAAWVGLGGYSQASSALEQIGTEVDCTASGRVASDAWFELVPAASVPIGLRVRPGDLMAGSVTAVGHSVTVSLSDLSSHHGFQRTVQAASIDVSSAEWIVEAPSACPRSGACQVLPLSDFGSAQFALARARATTGHIGTISDRAWSATRISLTPGGRQFIADSGGSGPRVGIATPSALSAGGSSFNVTFSQVSSSRATFNAQRDVALRSGHLVHPAADWALARMGPGTQFVHSS